MTEYGDVLAEWRKDAAALTAQLRDYQARVIPAETRVVALEAALIDIDGVIDDLRRKLAHAEKRFEISEASRDSMRQRMEKAEATIAAIKGAMQ